MTKLFVGGLPYATTTDELTSMFSQFGKVSSCVIITDKFTGQSKGFGFIEMENDEEAQKAIGELNGYEMNGRKIGVSVARPREDRPQNGGFQRGGNRDFNRGGRDRGRR